MKTKILLFLSIIALCTVFIWNYKSIFQGGAKEKTKDSSVPNPNLLIIPEERLQNLTIKTIEVELSHFSKKIELLGETEAVPDSIIDVPARVSGRVTSVKFVEGDKIKKGQLLAVIDSPELARLRSAYQMAKTKNFAAEQNYERIKSLVQMNLSAKQELIDAESNLRIIRAEKSSAEENLRVNGLNINDEVSGIYHVIAPRSGLAISRNAILGSQVLGNQNLTTIAELSHLWFMAKIFENDLQNLSEGDKAYVVLNSYPDMKFEGSLNHIGEKVDPISRTIHARIVFKNQGGKGKIGLFGKAYIEISPKEGIKIPNKAIQKMNDKNFVFIQKSKNEYEWREIEIGSTIDDHIEVKSGVSLNEFVVIDGSFELKAIHFKSTYGDD
ncbi:MAG: efflux RND transporter periplasmic adaptor subunit [Leptospira sp.]|nr:efflux RND transporter periplasmic adaptor subunit [Leptospira sp.]